MAFRTMLGARSSIRAFYASRDRTGLLALLPDPVRYATPSRTEEEWLKSVADYYANQGKPNPGANHHAH